MSTKHKQIPLPELPEVGLYDIFFDKWGFSRIIVKRDTCMFCEAVGSVICDKCAERADEAWEERP